MNFVKLLHCVTVDDEVNPRVNAYTIEKRGVRKLIYQAPWFRDGIVQGLVELSLEIPDAMPHFIREG